MHLVWSSQPARTSASASLDKQGLPSGPERTRGAVEHSELFQGGATPTHGGSCGIPRRVLPNHQTTEATGFSPAPGRQPLLDRIGDLRLGGYPGGPYPKRKGSTDGLTPSALYARRCFFNRVRVRGKEFKSVSEEAFSSTASASASCASAGPFEQTAPSRAQHVARCIVVEGT